MNQFRRCRISSEVFGSLISLWYMKSSYILAKFITSDKNVNCYPNQVQYYFSHTINLPNRLTKHFLAYVWWYQPTDSPDVRYHFSDNEQTCNVELWGTKFYPESHDCIIPLYHILGRFVLVNYRISTRRNTREYLAINPINRKYYIWQKIILNISSNFPNFTISDLCNKDSWLWSNLSFFIWIFQILNFLNFLSFMIFWILRFFLEF